jgi:hydrogenase maturation protease
MPRVLIVAYGNPLRCDDGVAWRAADALESKFPESEVEILRLHQLAPEVADTARQRDLILFVDAACRDDVKNIMPGQIRVTELFHPESHECQAAQFSHVYSPAKILDLARDLYQESPKAFVITVAGADFGHGDRLSNAVAAAIPSLVAKVEQIVRARSQVRKA